MAHESHPRWNGSWSLIALALIGLIGALSRRCATSTASQTCTLSPSVA